MKNLVQQDAQPLTGVSLQGNNMPNEVTIINLRSKQYVQRI